MSVTDERVPPVERKVQAGTAAAAVSGLLLWILGQYVFKTGVPDVVTSAVYVLIPAVVTFTAGYFARHTPRPAPAAARPAKTLIPPPPAGPG